MRNETKRTAISRRKLLSATAACAVTATLPPVRSATDALAGLWRDVTLRDGWILVPEDLS